MIVPEKIDSKRQRRVSSVSTAVSAFLAIIVLAFVNPDLSQTQAFIELDMEKWTYKPKPPPELVEPEVTEEVDEIVAEKAVSEDIQRQEIDLSDILPSGINFDMNTASPTSRAQRPKTGSAGRNRTIPMDQDLGQVGGFETLKGVSETIRSAAGRSLGTAGTGQTGIQLDTGPGNGAGPAASGTMGGGIRSSGEGPGGVQGRGETAGGRSVEVGLKNLTDFGGNYESLETKAVCEWMRLNPTDLPRSVRSLMTAVWDTDLLSAWEYVPLSDGRQFDLLLMCKEELYELHIVLIEQTNLTYLVDRSFQGESRKVRVGTVRLGNGTILSVNSTERAASDTRNRALYQVFLSWWGSVKPEVI